MEDGEYKREHDRYGVSFALEVFESDQRIGQVIDISEGGLRVQLDGDLGENVYVREWTGRKGTSNKEYILNELVGQVLTLKLKYMGVAMGEFKARLVRVIRVMNQVHFAMCFEEISPTVLTRVTTIAKKRSES